MWQGPERRTKREFNDRQTTTTTTKEDARQRLSTLTSLPVVLDFDRSVVVSDDVLPVDPGAVPQVLVVNNLDSSLQNLCHIKV